MTEEEKKEHDNAKEAAMRTIRTFFESLGMEVIDLEEITTGTTDCVTTDVETWRHKLADAKLEDARRRADIGKYDA